MEPQATHKRRSSASRIDALSVLPVFLELKGKSVIVVGDGNAARWKLELLARTGARVRYICKQPTPELLDLLSNNSLDVSVETKSWRQTDFAGAMVIVADVKECDAEEFFLCARATTSMVNIVDRPAFCSSSQPLKLDVSLITGRYFLFWRRLGGLRSIMPFSRSIWFFMLRPKIADGRAHVFSAIMSERQSSSPQSVSKSEDKSS